MNTTPEPEAALRLQASSPAQDYRSDGGAQGAAEKRPAQASDMGGQIAKGRERAPDGQAIDERVGKPGKRGGQHSNGGMSADGNQGGQIARGDETPQGGQDIGERVGKAAKNGGQIEQVIPRSFAHPNFRAWVGKAATPENPAMDDAIPGQQAVEGQATSWLKSLLPESQSGWWEVGDKGKGFSVRFRWRDTARQTLLFPQITGQEFTSLKQCGSEEAARILHERISANLHSFLLDPAKRDKALIVARKLGTNLDEYKIADAKD